MNTLYLPNIRVLSGKDIFINEHLLALGGRAPGISWLQAVAKNRVLWAVDRGLNIVKSAKLTPDFLIGDNDSADKDNWNDAVAKGVKYEKYPVEKDFTDLELTLTKLPPNAFAILTGGFGGRFDHTFSNVFSAAHAKNPLCLADEKETLLFLKDNDEFEITFDKNPKALSLIPITKNCAGVTLEGTRWQLKNANLFQNNPNAVSNVLENSNKCKIKIFEGILGFYVLFEEDGL